MPIVDNVGAPGEHGRDPEDEAGGAAPGSRLTAGGPQTAGERGPGVEVRTSSGPTVADPRCSKRWHRRRANDAAVDTCRLGRPGEDWPNDPEDEDGMAALFVPACRRALQRGLLRSYRTVEADLPMVKGRLRWNVQAR